MLNVEKLSKQERKKLVKAIENHLKNYKHYSVGIINMERKIKYHNSLSKNNEYTHVIEENESDSLHSRLTEYQLLVETIDCALEELNEMERSFIEYRYFDRWSMEKCAQHLQYSNQSLFVLRNKIMEKLIISLDSIIVK